MSDTPLLDRDWRIDGSTFDEVRDGARLCAQRRQVLAYCLRMDCEMTLAEISEATGHPVQSVSASLRDFRKSWIDKATGERHTSAFVVDSRCVRKGLWVYRVSRKSDHP